MSCKIKQYTGCATCYKRHDCEECESRMSDSNVMIGILFLIFIFAFVTWFIIGG